MRIIINTEQDLNALRTREENPLNFHLVQVPEMVENTFLIVCERDTADLILNELGDESNYEIIGAWNKEGKFYDDFLETETKGKDKEDKDKEENIDKKESHKFKKSKYKAKLRKKRVYADENDTKGTLVDAPEDTLVINVAGCNRITIDIDEE